MTDNIFLGDTQPFHFPTVAPSTAVPTTLAGTPVISAYPNDSTTQITAGITLTVDHDGLTGSHVANVVATAANGYLYGTKYTLKITTGTVDSVSAVGHVIGEFYTYASADDRLGLVDYGVAQSFTSTTAVLRAALSIPDSEIVGSVLRIGNQTRLITAWDSATDTATVDQWTTTPTGTPNYKLWASPPASASDPIPIDDTNLFKAIQLVLRKDAAIATDNATQLTAINADGGSGAGNFDNTTDSQEAILDTGAADWVTGAGASSKHNGSTQSGSTASTVILANAASNGDDYYKGDLLTLDQGSAAGEGEVIVNYVGSTRAATVKSAFSIAPSNNTNYHVDVVKVTSEITREGYADDSIWIDSVNGTSGSTVDFNGTQDNKVDNIAGAKILAEATGHFEYMVSNGSAVTLPSAHVDYIIESKGASIDMNGQSIAGTKFLRCVATGIGLGDGTRLSVFEIATVFNASIPSSILISAGMAGTVTLNELRDYQMQDCQQTTVLSSSPVSLIVGGDGLTARTITNARFTGDEDVQTMTSTDTYLRSGSGNLTINANCTGGTIILSGKVDYPKAYAGPVTIIDINNFNRADFLADDVAFNGADVGVGVIPKNAVFSNFPFPMYDSNGDLATGLTVTGVRTLDGGATSAVTGTISEIGLGMYKFDMVAADNNGDTLGLVFSAAGAKSTSITLLTK